jgi:hypothetical protein
MGQPMMPQQAMGPVTIRVKVIGAKGLTACDANGKSDPYAILRYEGQPKPYSKKEGQVEAKKSKKAKKGKISRPQTTVQKKVSQKEEKSEKKKKKKNSSIIWG